MQTLIVQWLPWLLSAITIVTSYMQGSKHPKVWLLSLAGQAGWAAYIVAAEAWGFAPLTAMLVLVYWRNHLKWKREAEADFEDSDHDDADDADKPAFATIPPHWKNALLDEVAKESHLAKFVDVDGIPEANGRTIRFRRYNPQPVTLADYVDNVHRYENGIDFEPTVPGIETKELSPMEELAARIAFEDAEMLGKRAA